MGRTRRLDPPALVTHPSRGFGGQDLGTGRGSDGCHPVPFSRWRRERGPEAAVPPAPSWQPGVGGGGGLRPEAGRIPGRRMGETAQGLGGACLLGRSELVSVAQVLSEEELGLPAGVNLGSSAYPPTP